jgi:ribonuclease HI
MGLRRSWRSSNNYITLRVKMKYAARLKFQCTNNIAEYEAILLGLRKERAMGASTSKRSLSTTLTPQILL